MADPHDPTDPVSSLAHKEHLGDGVYAGWDGFQVVLWLGSTGTYGLNAIAMEFQVYEALRCYLKRLRVWGQKQEEKGD